MTNEDGELQALNTKAKAYLKSMGREENLFQLKAKNVVFVVVDMQNFVCDPQPGQSLFGITRVITLVNTMVDFCHEQEIPVIWLRQCFSRKGDWDDVGLYEIFHQHPLEPGMFNHGEATEIHSELHLDQKLDLVVKKTCYSALAPGSSRLESLLSGMRRKQLILGGVATNVCVESTARDAMQRGYQVTVLADATTTFDKLIQHISLLNIKLFFGDVRSVVGVIREIGV